MKFYVNIGKLQQLQVIMTSINIVKGSKFTFLASIASKFVSDCFKFVFLHPTTHKPPLQKQPDLYKN